MAMLESGMGIHAMWGYTPALDLLADVPSPDLRSDPVGAKEVNVLLVQPGDVGHVLRTMCSRRRHRHSRINLYIWDKPLEALARHLLLLQVVHDLELPFRQRTSVFLEIFGNAKVQERTSRYVARQARELTSLVCDGRGALAKLVDFSLLKFRERDALESIFRSWAHDVPYDVGLLRDHRLRNFFRERYDARRNIIDWDYTGRVKEVAGVIHLKQYRAWRLEGVAYEFGDQVYDHPNRSMASYVEGMLKAGEHRGLVKEVRGYWLDIRTGPFATFGVDCERRESDRLAADLFLVLNKGTGTEQQRHNTAEVAVYNILSYLWELENGTPYAMTREHDVYSGLGEEAAASVPAAAPAGLVAADASAAAAAAAATTPPPAATVEPAEREEGHIKSATKVATADPGAANASSAAAGSAKAAALPNAGLDEAAASAPAGEGKKEPSTAHSASQKGPAWDGEASQASNINTAGEDSSGGCGKVVRKSIEEAEHSCGAAAAGQGCKNAADSQPAGDDGGSCDETERQRTKRQAASRSEGVAAATAGIKVYLLGGEADAIFAKARFRGSFDRVHVSSNGGQTMGLGSFNDVLADGAIITAETARYVVPLSKVQQESFATKVSEMAKDRGWSLFRDAQACAGGAGGSGSDILCYRFAREKCN